MDFSIENDFVKRAIKKDYQERIIFELQSQKHREKAIDRLSHSPETILKDVFTEYTVNDFSNVLGNINAKEKCYIISQNLHDGEELLLKDAIEYFRNSYTVVILITYNFFAIKAEVEKGSAPIWFYKF